MNANRNKHYGSGALTELRDLIQEYKNLENNFNDEGEEQEEENDDERKGNNEQTPN